MAAFQKPLLKLFTDSFVQWVSVSQSFSC